MYTIDTFKIPAPCEPFTAAVTADLHGKPFDFIRSALEKRKPDVILIPGDICSEHISKEAYDEDPRPRLKKYDGDNALGFLRMAASIAPVYYSKGNHEWKFEDRDWALVRECGVHHLQNEFISFRGINIGGFASFRKYGSKYIDPFRKEPDTSWLDAFAEKPGFHLLLCHHPEDYFHFIQSRPIELTISGHAHGGQWRFRNQGVFAPGQGLFPKYTKGFYDGNRLLVSAGLSNTGNWVPRLGNPMQLIYLEIGGNIE